MGAEIVIFGLVIVSGVILAFNLIAPPSNDLYQPEEVDRRHHVQ